MSLSVRPGRNERAEGLARVTPPESSRRQLAQGSDTWGPSSVKGRWGGLLVRGGGCGGPPRYVKTQRQGIRQLREGNRWPQSDLRGHAASCAFELPSGEGRFASCRTCWMDSWPVNRLSRERQVMERPYAAGSLPARGGQWPELVQGNHDPGDRDRPRNSGRNQPSRGRCESVWVGGR